MTIDSSHLDLDEVDYVDVRDEATGDRAGSLNTRLESDEIVLTWIPRGESAGLEMLRFDRSENLLRIVPRWIRSGQLRDQFSQIEELQVEAPAWDPHHHSEESDRYGLLYATGLPEGFNRFYTYGLGINRHYQDFVNTIEKHSTCTVVRFGYDSTEGPSPDGKTFRVSLGRFERYRAAVELNRVRGRTAASRVNEAACHNAVADLLELAPVDVKYGRNEVIRKLTEEVSTGYVMNASDRTALVDQLSLAAPAVALETPKRFGQLRADIELVSLETLIDQFEKDLAGAHAKNEQHWQDFFDSNRFALQLLFSMPIVVVQAQAHVQGADLTGKGARIADFLCANVLTRSAIVVEIKTPGTAIMASNPYRGTGTAAVHSVHKDLSGSMAQLQSQMIAIPQELSLRLSRAPEVDLDPWNDVRGAIITGKLSALSEEQRESFVRYRAGLSNVTILGYDEVLERLKALLDMLKHQPALASAGLTSR